MRLRVDVLCPLLGIVFGIAVACSSQERTNSGVSPTGNSAAVSVLQQGSSNQ